MSFPSLKANPIPMKKLTQAEVVRISVRSVFPEGIVPPTKYWKPLQKAHVYGKVFEYFHASPNLYSRPHDVKTLRKYIPGLVNNWLRKSKELNGGKVYVSKTLRCPTCHQKITRQ